MTRVASSVIAEVTYDGDRSLLDVLFHNGRLYRYVGVPAEEYEAMLAADSIGRYFNQEIRTRYRVLKKRDGGS